MSREYFKGEREESKGFSQAVATRGGKTIWLAGVTARTDERGNSLSGNFEAQVHEVFRKIGERLHQAGGNLRHLVTMTVYLLDVRHGPLFSDVRKQYFSEGYPASAQITVAGFAHPDIMLEVQAIAVVDDS